MAEIKLKEIYRNGTIKYQCWSLNEKLHRKDGPARTWYNEDGSIGYQEWWLNHEPLGKEDFTSLEMIKRMKAYSLFTVKEIARMKLDKPI